MYLTKGVYQEEATYIPVKDTYSFFKESCNLAIRAFHDNIIFDKKKNNPIVYGSEIEGFNNEKKCIKIKRKKMNKLKLLRDFVGIDWDFEEGQEKELKKTILNSKKFAKEYDTTLIIYPTASYPKKPRIRTVFLLEDLLDEKEYKKAVSFILDKIDVNPNDDNNYNIYHQFNLPTINNEFQLKIMKIYKYNKLKSKCFKNQKLPKSLIDKKNKKLKEFSVTGRQFEIEKSPRNDKEVERAITYILEQMKTDNYLYDWSVYTNFVVKFMHSLARTEVIGAITHEQAERILIAVAEGDKYYETRNLKDYEIELNYVSTDEQKLKNSYPFARYAGLDW